MDVSELRLKERTALLVGPLSRVHQSLAQKLTRLGADVVFASTDLNVAQRFANQILETREIHEKFGRAGAVPYNASSPAEASDMVSRAAEFFGGVDFLIESTSLQNAESVSAEALLTYVTQTAQAVIPFLKGRKRGRIVYLLHELHQQNLPGTGTALNAGITNLANTLARELADQNVTVNCVVQGLTEEFLLAYDPKSSSVQTSLQELRKTLPGIQITDPERIADTVTFFVSAMGAGVTGQTMTVRNGAARLE